MKLTDEQVKAILARMIEALDAKGLPQLAEKLATSRTNLDNWVKRGTVPESNLLKVAQLGSVRIQWLKTGEGEKTNPIDQDNPLFNSLHSQISFIKTICSDNELFKNVLNDLFMQIQLKINETIAKLMVENILKVKEQTPFFERLKALSWFDEVGATVMFHSIFAYSKKEQDKSAKDAFLKYAESGKFSVPPTAKTRMMFLKTISTLDDEICEYIYENQELFSNSIKAISPKINSIIESNKKFDITIEKIVDFFVAKKS
jgi:hypothetical protein